jgi:NADH-quinone oxidoreductase subunit G
LPHRKAGGVRREAPGLDASRMPDAELDTLLLFGIEPERDHAAGGHAVERLTSQSGFVASMTAFASPDLLQAADLLLPIGTFAETSGTFVNCEGRWQSFGGAASPVGESRPGWKVLRVLGNLHDLDGFEYQTSEAVRDELRARLGRTTEERHAGSAGSRAEEKLDNSYRGTGVLHRASSTDNAAASDVPMYEVDSLVRRATALQLTPEAARARGDDQGRARQDSAA